MKAADRGLEIFFSETVDIRICVLPDGLDPDELLKQDGGRERFDEALAKSVDAMQYVLNRFESTLEGLGMSGRQKRLEAFLAHLAQMGFGALQGVRKQMVLMRLADLMRLPVGAIEQALARLDSVARKSVASESRLQESEVESKPPATEEEIHVSRARRLAEFEFLGLAMYEPTLALRVLAEAGGEAPFETSRFLQASSRAIAEALLGRLRLGVGCTVQQIMAELEDEEHRKTASSLYFEGERLCGDNDQRAWEAMQHASAALDACIAREQLDYAVVGLNDGPDHALTRVQEILNHRRKAGHIASAISRGARG
jgi:DNA primase